MGRPIMARAAENYSGEGIIKEYPPLRQAALRFHPPSSALRGGFSRTLLHKLARNFHSIGYAETEEPVSHSLVQKRF